MPPAVVRQSLPAFAGRVLGDATGIIDVVIDAMGGVEKATIRASIDPRGLHADALAGRRP